MSTSQLPPLALCSSTDVWPPEKACLLILFFTCLGVSVKNMDELSSLALIFVWAPCNAGKNVECNKAGFLNLSVGATSRVIRKYGSWSIAQGIRHVMSFRLPKMKGKLELKLGTAWTAGNIILPM